MDGSGLGDTFWVLSGYGGMAQMDSVMPDVQVSFQFDPAENRVSGRSGCNNYIGEVEVDYARMTFKVAPMGMTRMACAEDVMAQESAYLDTLGRVASYAVEDGKRICSPILMRFWCSLRENPPGKIASSKNILSHAANVLYSKIWQYGIIFFRYVYRLNIGIPRRLWYEVCFQVYFCGSIVIFSGRLQQTS